MATQLALLRTTRITLTLPVAMHWSQGTLKFPLSTDPLVGSSEALFLQLSCGPQAFLHFTLAATSSSPFLYPQPALDKSL